MDTIINSVNLKSLIMFFHLGGLAMGVGGAWMLDVFIMRQINNKISKEKYDLIEFVSRFVLYGLLFLWISGFGFLAFYYVYSPELLLNQKVWAKLFIVSVLSINGYFIHTYLLPKIKRSVGQTLIQSVSLRELQIIVVLGSTSFVSWLFPIVLGVGKTLNFTVAATDILFVYMIAILAVISVSMTIASYIAKPKDLKFSAKRA